MYILHIYIAIGSKFIYIIYIYLNIYYLYIYGIYNLYIFIHTFENICEYLSYITIAPC